MSVRGHPRRMMWVASSRECRATCRDETQCFGGGRESGMSALTWVGARRPLRAEGATREPFQPAGQQGHDCGSVGREAARRWEGQCAKFATHRFSASCTGNTPLPLVSSDPVRPRTRGVVQRTSPGATAAQELLPLSSRVISNCPPSMPCIALCARPQRPRRARTRTRYMPLSVCQPCAPASGVQASCFSSASAL